MIFKSFFTARAVQFSSFAGAFFSGIYGATTTKNATSRNTAVIRFHLVSLFAIRKLVRESRLALRFCSSSTI